MKILKNYCLSLFVFIISICVLLLISSCVFAYTNIDDRYINIFIYLIVIISSLLSSFILSKKIKNKGLLHGIAINLIGMLLLFIVSSATKGNLNISNSFIIYCGISSICGVIGGVFGVNV